MKATLPPTAVLRKLLRSAWLRREALHKLPATTCYRVFHGFTDGVRALDIDRYGDELVATVKDDVFPVEQSGRLASLLKELEDSDGEGVSPGLRVTVRIKRPRSADPTPVRIDRYPLEAVEATAMSRSAPAAESTDSAPFLAQELGLYYEIDPLRADHPGLFLDARSLRQRLREVSRDAKVLNLFAFSGSLGVAAMAGGARSVTHVDKRKEPLEVAQRNHAANGQSVDRRNFVTGDVFKHLPRAARAGRRFDLVITDPPPEFRTGRRTPKVSRGDFRRAVALASPLVADRGRLIVLVHRHDWSQADYETAVAAATGDGFEVEHRGAVGEDFAESGEHPVKWIELRRQNIAGE